MAVSGRPACAGRSRSRSSTRRILPLTVLGSSRHELDLARVLVGRGDRLDVLLELVHQRVGAGS